MPGIKDTQTVTPTGEPFGKPNIDGVRVIRLNNILTRSGIMNEVFRSDWFDLIDLKQINWVELTPGGVTDWHRHAMQTDRLVGISGIIKLCLYDSRPDSPTKGETDVFRFGKAAPLMVIFPPGVWHGLRNEGGGPAVYLNLLEELYRHEEPDNYRLPSDSADIPIRL